MRRRFVYLAGAIWQEPDPLTWRRHAAQILPDGWAAIDPNATEMELDKAQSIIRDDLSNILRCDAVLAKVERPSWGTAMELFFAQQHRIPVIGWGDAKLPLSPWLDFTLHSHVIKLESAMRILEAM
jgi:nucleoside 2-deoxyribosyltransferase